MATKARITAEFPTPSEVASRLRIPPSRVAELRRQIELIAASEGTVPVKRRRASRRKPLSKKK
jgi:hypothetical protein